ncbi:uncharacterized protein LY79DRAFT_264829 [Colletotrichum navitas]|uniref:Uncharacterized protein n=1 Tax=Colletotrichum navitas TaxID=681940 RepID=A0AAD8PXT1_9PEZI|nr:uncharacterized protein LY79DRAFT_264829 [Colletotrichum navitas]KAK1585708.1 hypothetical protein LY79DRAFT_264829 [Colletotrichum navitas]
MEVQGRVLENCNEHLRNLIELICKYGKRPNPHEVEGAVDAIMSVMNLVRRYPAEPWHMMAERLHPLQEKSRLRTNFIAICAVFFWFRVDYVCGTSTKAPAAYGVMSEPSSTMWRVFFPALRRQKKCAPARFQVTTSQDLTSPASMESRSRGLILWISTSSSILSTTTIHSHASYVYLQSRASK